MDFENNKKNLFIENLIILSVIGETHDACQLGFTDYNFTNIIYLTIGFKKSFSVSRLDNSDCL